MLSLFFFTIRHEGEYQNPTIEGYPRYKSRLWCAQTKGFYASIYDHMFIGIHLQYLFASSHQKVTICWRRLTFISWFGKGHLLEQGTHLILNLTTGKTATPEMRYLTQNFFGHLSSRKWWSISTSASPTEGVTPPVIATIVVPLDKRYLNPGQTDHHTWYWSWWSW